ncbi:hypothetical protein [Rheinheimera mangrovi]|uniref:hypothetical protein n=1 Tax=Rheinheimera mangrovi TaxID=2498451 RepID=UPI000F8F7D7D|nr:hypothetical protein [Rheinheimera mangrovi]
MTTLAFLAIFAVLIGAACGISALVQLQKVKAELAELKKLLKGPTPVHTAPVAVPQPEVALNPLNPLSTLAAPQPVHSNKTGTELPSVHVFSALSGWIEQQLIKRGMV